MLLRRRLSRRAGWTERSSRVGRRGIQAARTELRCLHDEGDRVCPRGEM